MSGGAIKDVLIEFGGTTRPCIHLTCLIMFREPPHSNTRPTKGLLDIYERFRSPNLV